MSCSCFPTQSPWKVERHGFFDLVSMLTLDELSLVKYAPVRCLDLMGRGRGARGRLSCPSEPCVMSGNCRRVVLQWCRCYV